jgi:hypothetical protein
MCEGDKYVFAHESGKFLGVAGGQVCGLEKRQQQRPNQDVTSDFSVVTICGGSSSAAVVASAPSTSAKNKSVAADYDVDVEDAVISTGTAPAIKEAAPVVHEAAPAVHEAAPPIAVHVTKKTRKGIKEEASAECRPSEALASASSGPPLSDDDQPFVFQRVAADRPPANASKSAASSAARTSKPLEGLQVAAGSVIAPALHQKTALKRQRVVHDDNVEERIAAASGDASRSGKSERASEPEAVSLPSAFAL